ncbi:hypothetical protein BGZ76_011718 [Entomortierella beljakovae]|nr:hypothetical protein BGZ76_011718 [Entomortierella beljakovae]
MSKISLFIALGLASLSIASAQAPAANSTVSITFQDDAGVPIGDPQSIVYAKCTPLNLLAFNQETGEGYTTAQAIDPNAALNLYSDPYCQRLEFGTVGTWNSTSAGTAILYAVQWVGPAPATDPPGTFNPIGYQLPAVVTPPTTATPRDPFAMNPERGRILVGIVTSVLAIGVIVGIYQVYQAAQYVAPPKKPKKKKDENKIKGPYVGAKKVKKTEAFYKKPAKEGDYTAIGTDGGYGYRGGAETPGTIGGHSTRSDNRSTSMLLGPNTTFDRPDRFSVMSTASTYGPTLVTRSSPSPPNTNSQLEVSGGVGGYGVGGYGVGVGPGGGAGMGANPGRQQHADLLASESVLIDIHEPLGHGLQGPPSSNQNNNNYNNNNPGEFANFGFDTPYGNNNNNHPNYNNSSNPYIASTSSSSSSSSPAGRGGEVLVPMYQLDSRGSPTRRTGRLP